VLHDEGDAVRLRVDGAEELLVVDLRRRAVGESLLGAEDLHGVLKVVLGERVGHLSFLLR
jgi:hypothetical protein